MYKDLRSEMFKCFSIAYYESVHFARSPDFVVKVALGNFITIIDDLAFRNVKR